MVNVELLEADAVEAVRDWLGHRVKQIAKGGVLEQNIRAFIRGEVKDYPFHLEFILDDKLRNALNDSNKRRQWTDGT